MQVSSSTRRAWVACMWGMCWVRCVSTCEFCLRPPASPCWTFHNRFGSVREWKQSPSSFFFHFLPNLLSFWMLSSGSRTFSWMHLKNSNVTWLRRALRVSSLTRQIRVASPVSVFLLYSFFKNWYIFFARHHSSWWDKMIQIYSLTLSTAQQWAQLANSRKVMKTIH